MKIYTPLLLMYAITALTPSTMLWGGRDVDCFVFGESLYVAFNEKNFALVTTDKRDRCVAKLLTDGTVIPEEGYDPSEGAFRAVASETRIRVEVPYAPKIGKVTLRRLDKATTSGDAKKIEAAAGCYQTEGTAKCFCMTHNAKYDRFNNEIMSSDHDFEQPGKARRRYGTPEPMYAM